MVMALLKNIGSSATILKEDDKEAGIHVQ